MDWQEKLEIEAEKEFSALSKKSTSELLDMIGRGDYGKYQKIWKAVGLYAELKEIGWPLYRVLKTTDDETTRVACAESLLSAILSERVELRPHHFLDTNEKLADNIFQIREILIRKLGEE